MGQEGQYVVFYLQNKHKHIFHVFHFLFSEFAMSRVRFRTPLSAFPCPPPRRCIEGTPSRFPFGSRRKCFLPDRFCDFLLLHSSSSPSAALYVFDTGTGRFRFLGSASLENRQRRRTSIFKRSDEVLLSSTIDNERWAVTVFLLRSTLIHLWRSSIDYVSDQADVASSWFPLRWFRLN